MSRNSEYNSLIGCRQWRATRARYLAAHPLCERCLEENRTRLATEVHHKVPIESTKDRNRMKSLAYDINNLEALCQECHRQEHVFKPFIVRKRESVEKGRKNAKAFLESDFLKNFKK